MSSTNEERTEIRFSSRYGAFCVVDSISTPAAQQLAQYVETLGY